MKSADAGRGVHCMTETPSWQFDEFVQHGRDFSDPAEVAAYEECMAKLGDPATTADEAIAAMDLQPSDVVLDMGGGAGGFAVAAARRCARVHLVDVSAAMLCAARERAKRTGVANVEFHHAGFLTYHHAGGQVDAVHSRQALHHLPDYWKQLGLLRLADVLKDGGRLYLDAAVVSYRLTEHSQFIEESLACHRANGMPELAERIERHIREEFSTFDWVMEGMLRRAGFAIESCEYRYGVSAIYHCTKAGPS